MKLRGIAFFVLGIPASAATLFAGPPATTTFAGPSVLRSTYAVTGTHARYVSWYAEVSCPVYSGPLYAGSDVANETFDGTMLFDGKGGVTASITQYGLFDQDLSNLTPTWNCDLSGSPHITNPGHAVYDPPQPLNATGNYSVQSDYTGQISFSDGTQFKIRLSGVNWLGLATSFAVHQVKADNSSGDVGTGVMQLCGRWCNP